MAAEFFTVGTRDFRLPGLGAFLHEAAQQSDYTAIAWGIGALVLTVVLLDQIVWRPLLAWSDRFKVEMIENDNPPQSWFYALVGNGNLVKWISRRVIHPFTEWVDRKLIHRFPTTGLPTQDKKRIQIIPTLLTIALIVFLLYMLFQAGQMLMTIPLAEWGNIGLSVLVTLLRVTIALILALAWTIPLGVAIGTNKRLSAILQPVVQVIASIPATALFPVIILFVLNLPGGLNLAAIILMLMGTQWYLLFNIIAGASAIPQDLKYTTQLMQLNRRQRWRTLILPGIFPYLITGAITASGGAWNASIVAEYQNFGGETLSVNGIGSLIAHATVDGNYPLLLAATIAMVLTVVLVNRLVWRRLYVLAEEKYRMEV